MENLITKPTELSLSILREYVRKGDAVADATAGNGNDTLALAEMVGYTGSVFAFDIQESAIQKTKILLEKEGFFECCKLICGSHHRMRELLPAQVRGNLSAVVFNLGYLPGGDKAVATTGETTTDAVRQSLELIRPGGIVAVTMYSGHATGAEEKAALLDFSKNLPSKEYHAAYFSLINQNNSPPELLLITRKR